MVRFCHITDSHLGLSQFGLEERRTDLQKNFERAYKTCLEQSPDFIIHTGDFYDSWDPPVMTVNDTWKFLKNHKDTDLYIIPGNHDLPIYENSMNTPLTYFKLENFITVFLNRRHIEFVEKEYDGKIVKIWGIPWVAKVQLQDRLHQIKPSEYIDIGMIHASPIRELRDKELPKLEYLGVGHIHSKYKDTERRVYSPGSTSFINLEMEHEKKVIYIVDIDNQGIEVNEIDIPIRRHVILLPRISLENLSPEKFRAMLFDILQNYEVYESIVTIPLGGTIPLSKKFEIPFRKIIDDIYNEFSPLFVHFKHEEDTYIETKFNFANPLNVFENLEKVLESESNHDSILQKAREILGEQEID